MQTRQQQQQQQQKEQQQQQASIPIVGAPGVPGARVIMPGVGIPDNFFGFVMLTLGMR